MGRDCMEKTPPRKRRGPIDIVLLYTIKGKGQKLFRLVPNTLAAGRGENVAGDWQAGRTKSWEMDWKRKRGRSFPLCDLIYWVSHVKDPSLVDRSRRRGLT